MDIAFVHLPADLRFPVNDWCLGYRYLVGALRDAGIPAGIIYPRRAGGTRRPPRATPRAVADALVADVLAARPAVVGLTTYDPQLPAVMAFARRLRRAGLRAHITLGGLCASAVPAGILRGSPEIDSVVVGEGERSVVELAEWVLRGRGEAPVGVWTRDDRGVAVGRPRPFLDDLAALPDPAIDDLPALGPDSPVHRVAGCAPVIASRGCYGRCTFCCVQRFYRASPGRPWRGRPADHVAAEVAAVTRLTGLDRVTFVDENFMGPGRSGRRHAVEVARQLRARVPGIRFNLACRPNDVERETFVELRTAGLAGVTLGMESMCPQTLDLFAKHTTPAMNERALALLEELELAIEITFIFFQPLSTLDEVRTNLAFVDRVARSRYAYFSNGQPFTSFIPLAGTELAARFRQLGLVRQELVGGSVRYADPRVAFVARRVLAVPLDDLLRLAYALPVRASQRLAEVQRRLLDYHGYLAMRRLPRLTAELCDAVERYGPRRGARVDAATGAIAAEAARIGQLVERFAAHVPAGPAPVPESGRPRAAPRR
jgi:radical SAM superfamily enzyme YgiQ (UPF0313 family)